MYSLIMKNNIVAFIIFLTSVFTLTACEKFLDVKPDKTLSTPSSITDMQLLLDGYMDMNVQYPKASEIAADDYYLLSDNWQALTNQTERNIYLWKKDVNTDAEWNSAYKAIATTNIILSELEKINASTAEQDAYNNVLGSALFFRSYYFYSLAQLFANPYNIQSAYSDPGIPVRTTADFNAASERASVQETYDRILSDFKQAVVLLPSQAAVKSRPTKPAAYGAIARTHLVMAQYDSAAKYARLCLDLYDVLLDYNTLDSLSYAPIKQFNEEVIFQLLSIPAFSLANSIAKIDSTLYGSYHENDLRKKILFSKNPDDTYEFKGDYNGSGFSTGYVFAGIVTDEIYLILAECQARMGETDLAMNTLNSLLQNRWESGTFTPYEITVQHEAIALILGERRKELIRRGVRWTDLRRLKDDPHFAVIPQRIINGETFLLTADSEGYVLQIPQTVINRTGMPQN